MPSILSRLRTRAVSQTSRASAQSSVPLSTTPTTITTPTHDIPAPEEPDVNQNPTQEPAYVVRKIYPNLDLLPDEFTADPPAIRHGLSPPIRRGTSSNLPSPITGPAHPSIPSILASEEDSPPTRRGSESSAGDGTASGRGLIERLGDWSTFGRRRAPPPSLNEFGEQVSPSPSAWRKPRVGSRRSSRLSSKTPSIPSSPRDNSNKENTPRPSYQSSSSHRTPATATHSNSYKHISTPVARDLGFDSPRTLGHPGPEVSLRNAPPMPLLDPRIPARARSKTETYPPRVLRVRTKSNVEISPGRFTFGTMLRPYRSLPRVQDIFRPRVNMGEGEDNDGDNALAADAAENNALVPIPTVSSWPTSIPPASQPHSSPSPPSSSPSSSSSAKSAPSHARVGPIDPNDHAASNLYDPSISTPGNASHMQQDAPRVRDQKPLRSSLKANARPSPAPIASSSSLTQAPSTLMPSFSLVAAAAASDVAPPQTPSRSDTAKGKRKAEDVDTTPPDPKKATFAVPISSRENLSHAPSSYHNKRARLSGPTPSPAPSNAHNTGTYASSRASSRLARPSSSTRSAAAGTQDGSERERRRSLSARSIPLSALVTPHAPSIGRADASYHMRDPRRPRRATTGWALRLRSPEQEGAPVHAWLFYVAFVLFPLWWVGAVWRVPRTRHVGGTDTEKAVPLDDPQIESDARSWRTRCRIMAVVSLFTYIPFIVCVAVFASR